MSELPTVVVTGASGFMGQRLIQRLRHSYRVVALDWHARAAAAGDPHPNVLWHNLDVADEAAVRECFAGLRKAGGAAALVHLAAYYDFTGEEHPEYQRTNVGATRNLLEQSLALNLERFVFASSVAACEFNEPGRPITEDTPADGTHPYSRSKAEGERMLREFSSRMPTCAIRFAAIFSDWCEYPPLYEFLGTWLTRRWNARILAGRGESSIPFLHARDSVRFVQRVLERRTRLDPFEIVVASQNGSVTHRELFETATEYYFGRRRKPILMPKALCGPGIRVREAAGHLQGRQHFERPWMVTAIDKRLDVDASRTRERLAWSPQDRLDVLRRLPYMIENMKSDPVEWMRRNVEVMDNVALRPNLRVYRLIEKHEPEILEGYAGAVAGREGDELLRRYRTLAAEEDEWHNRLALRSLITSIRTGEKKGFMTFCRDLAGRRMAQGFEARELVHAVRTLERACVDAVRRDPEAAGLDSALHDHLEMTVEFGIDQILEAYDDAEYAEKRPA